MHEQHQPVLLEEVIEGLNIKENGLYVDGTFGRGGHAKAILKKLGPDGKLLVLDKDEAAIQMAKKIKDKRLLTYHSSIANLQSVIEEIGWMGYVNGIVLDLGVSSPQLDNADRGFSFLRDGPLDMRMNQKQEMDASQWLNQADASEIVRILKEYGEEPFARRIAQTIVRERQKQPLLRTSQLTALIQKIIPAYKRKHHVATRTFQAIRIFINQELEELQRCLLSVLDILSVGGRLCIITFHSLENRIVQRFIRKLTKVNIPAQIPLQASEMPKPKFKLFRCKIPSESEIQSNIRARSARLTIAEKLA